MKESIDLKSLLAEAFKAEEVALNGATQEDFFQQRKQAFSQFESMGFPTTKHEEWKYTNVRNLISESYNFSHPDTVTQDDLDSLQIPNLKGNILYFINGTYRPDLSTIVSPSEQVTILPLSEAKEKQPELFFQYFNKLAKNTEEAFTALNTAFATEGAFIHVPAGVVVEEPIILRYIADSRNENIGVQTRIVIAAEKNAEVKIAEAFRTLGDLRSFSNLVTEIHVAEEAHIEYYKVQNDTDQSFHIGTTQVQMHDRSHFYSATVTLNGGLVRNNLHIEIDGQYCEAHMYGLYAPNGKQLVDNHTLADHRQPNSYSNELYKGVLRDSSVGVFNGKIFVRQDAQKTNAYQNCKNVVLSPNAKMNTKPQLEIFADDVKCSHGTTTGQLDEEALFYMRSRGIPQAEAMGLLMYAFCEDVIRQIRIDPIREYLTGVIESNLNITE